MGNGIPANAVAMLMKAASDGGVRVRMEKSAKFLYGAGKSLLGGAKNLAKRPFTTPTGLSSVASRAPLRQFSPGRTAATAGAVAATPVAAGVYSHLDQNAANTEGMGANPLTWGRNAAGRRMGLPQGPSKDSIYAGNQHGMDDVFNRSSLKGEIEAAQASGDSAKFIELMKRKQTGDFDVDHGWSMDKIMDGKMPDVNPLNYRMGGLNPWAHTSAKTSRGRMDAAQSGLQGEYDSALRKAGPQPEDAANMQQLQAMMAEANPADLPMYQQQMEALKARMGRAPGTEDDASKGIRERMTAAGMRHKAWKPPAAPGAPASPSPSPMAGGPGMGRRPGVQGWAVDPYDFRRQDPWEAVIGGPKNSPMQFAG